MASTPLASSQDLADWLGQRQINEDRANAVLVAASAMVRSEAGQTWLDDGGALDSPPETVVAITVQVAAKMWANPTGVSQQTTGPFSSSFARQYLTPEDRKYLNSLQPTAGVWTLSTTREELETPDTIDVEGQDEPIPSGDPW